MNRRRILPPAPPHHPPAAPVPASTAEVKARHVAGQAAEASAGAPSSGEAGADWLAERILPPSQAPAGVPLTTQGTREPAGGTPVLESRRGAHK